MKPYSDFANIPTNGPNPRCMAVWLHVINGADVKTPEGRYGFDELLRTMLDTIEPVELRHHYQAFFRHHRAQLYAVSGGWEFGTGPADGWDDETPWLAAEGMPL